MTETVGTPPRNRRRTTFIVLTVVFGLGLGLGAFAFLGLVTAWFGLGDREVHRVHDLAGGAHGGLLIALPFLLQAWGPERKPAVMQGAAAAGLGLALGYALGGQPVFALVPIVVSLVLWAFHPSRGQGIRLGGRPQPIMIALALLAAIPLVMYALDQAAIQRACIEGDQHCDEFHYAGMAALAYALPLAAFVASFPVAGRRIVARLVGAAAVVFGLSGVLFPDAVSSIGRTWGAVTLGVGVLFVAVAEWGTRDAEGSTAG
jgi:hypothetical protein